VTQQGPARPEALLAVQGLGFAHAGQTPLFSGFSAQLPPGLCWLAGDTGSGKTTLLRLLAGELPATWAAGGHLRLGTARLDRDPAAYRRQVCWFDPRNPAWDALTPAGLMAAQRALHPALDEAAWQRHLAGFELLPHADKGFYALSTGSRRKAALAVALSSAAPLILLDEPTAGLDGPALRHLARALGEADARPDHLLLLATSQGRDAVPGAPAGRLITLPDRDNQG